MAKTFFYYRNTNTLLISKTGFLLYDDDASLCCCTTSTTTTTTTTTTSSSSSSTTTSSSSTTSSKTSTSSTSSATSTTSSSEPTCCESIPDTLTLEYYVSDGTVCASGSTTMTKSGNEWSGSFSGLCTFPDAFTIHFRCVIDGFTGDEKFQVQVDSNGWEDIAIDVDNCKPVNIQDYSIQTWVADGGCGCTTPGTVYINITE